MEYCTSVYNDNSAHYNIFTVQTNKSEDFLREVFSMGVADELNVCLFSTSGVHGTYNTIEDTQIEDDCKEVTFLLIQPRRVSLYYGNIVVTEDNIEFLKQLRKTSKEIINKIGEPND